MEEKTKKFVGMLFMMALSTVYVAFIISYIRTPAEENFFLTVRGWDFLVGFMLVGVFYNLMDYFHAWKNA